jgi:protein-S-isoprenylcysteine O-methyltransferase Ste14
MLYSIYALIGILWIAFWIYWLVSSFNAKKTVRTGNWWYGALVRVVFLIIIILLMQSLSIRNLVISQESATASLPIAVAGALIVIAGLAFAVWARIYLGKNWGMPMSVRENPELVTGGPYGFVRHPIYTGELLGLIGTALAVASIWFYIFIFAGIYFIYSATQEEKLMAQKFPDQYPAYKKRTKMLIPFVF